MSDEIGIEEFLEAQEAARLSPSVTLEAIDHRPDDVKITPWCPDAGCMCAFAITVPKAAIGSVTSLDQEERCCGKTLKVVEVAFADEMAGTVFAGMVEAICKGVVKPQAQSIYPFDTCTYRLDKCPPEAPYYQVTASGSSCVKRCSPFI